MAEFYPDGESHLRSEKLDIAWRESLIVKIGRASCGNCRAAVPEPETSTRCPQPDCDTDWRQAIYLESIDSFRHQTLPMIGKAAISSLHASPRKTRDDHLPFIRGRFVKNIRLTGTYL